MTDQGVQTCLFNLGSENPPACRRVLWIVLVSIACIG